MFISEKWSVYGPYIYIRMDNMLKHVATMWVKQFSIFKCFNTEYTLQLHGSFEISKGVAGYKQHQMIYHHFKYDDLKIGLQCHHLLMLEVMKIWGRNSQKIEDIASQIIRKSVLFGGSPLTYAHGTTYSQFIFVKNYLNMNIN